MNPLNLVLNSDINNAKSMPEKLFSHEQLIIKPLKSLHDQLRIRQTTKKPLIVKTKGFLDFQKML
jgi:hypothetical protein